MRSNILNYINKLQSYKTAIKNLHWSSKRMSEHKLLDDIADSVAENQDEIAEIAQGIYGKIKNNELKPRRYKIIDSRKMIDDLTKDTKEFHSTINGKELIGLRSVVESFIGELNKFKYLMVMCVKEDFKRNYKENQLNENNYKSRYHKMMAAKHASGLDSETARNEMSNYFAKQQAIRDINKHRSVSTMDDHEREFNNQINGDTFDVDFRDLDLYGESKIRISENELRSVIREAIDNVFNVNSLNESSPSYEKKKIINLIYKNTQKITSRMYSDEFWQGVNFACEAIENTIANNGELNVWVENGGYWKQLGEFPNYKEYKIRINMNSGIEINGSIKCHSAGTIEDTFKYYDITITLW